MYGWQVMEKAAELERRGESFALATVVWRQGPSSSQLGARAIMTASGEVFGWIGGACAEPSVIRQAQQVITEGQPRLLLLGTTDQFGDAIPEGMTVVPIACQSEGAMEVYIEPVLPVPHLVVVGRSPMAHTLTDLARVLGWRAELRDWTEFVAAGAGGSGGSPPGTQSGGSSPRASAAAVSPRSMVVVATQGHGDEEAIEQAVAGRPAYVGLVGSRKRGAAVLGYLAERGVPPEQLDRVKVPAGLDLGRTTHSEIAVSILAELVRLRASGQIPAFPAVTAQVAERAEIAEAIDPVCGMTVAATPASRPLTHDGVTYYFCGAGCHHQFQSDPASHARNETRC